MKYLTFSQEESTSYSIAILASRLNKADMDRYYVSPFLDQVREKVIAYDLHKLPKKTPVAQQKEYLEDLLPVLTDLGIEYIVVTDGDYFKTLTKSKTVDAGKGYVLDSVVGDFKVVYAPSYTQMFYDPDKVKTGINQGMSALVNYGTNTYVDPGNDIIQFAAYPKTTTEIKDWLQRLIDMDCDLTADIEAFSLKHFSAGIGTITFCWNKHEGIAFPVDVREPTGPLQEGHYWERWKNEEVRGLLQEFFSKIKRNIKWHNITYDVYVLIYQLFMKDLLDTKGLLSGLDLMLDNWDDTRLISYLATNSCAGNKLSLKVQAQEFAGNYAEEEIKEIQKIPLDQLLRYNLVDGLSTWFVYEKHYPTLIKDQQKDIYDTLFKDAVKDIIQMQLTGLPIDMEEVEAVDKELKAAQQTVQDTLDSSMIAQEFTEFLRVKWMNKKHSEWKKKRITLDEVPVQKETVFNPNSAPQLQTLLYDKAFMGMPVLDLTDSKLPATGSETLEKLLNHTQDPDEIAFLEALIDYKTRAIILSTFLPAFLAAPQAPDGWHYLFGYFNLGGTVSGRLSSSDPNLQNIPSGGKNPAKAALAKMIKRCVKAPPGYLFIGLDFNSLEDMISALTTKDPMKIKVYKDGYDGHCLRAYAYFKDEMPDIDPSSVKSINSIDNLYGALRQKSKAPTFALTYQGTYVTLMNNCGFTEELARSIEASYHELYKVSDQWVQDRLQEATQTGYITAAFGLRVRTPLLKQVILGTSKTPYEAAAEGRTAGNALGQSWCLLNTRAASDFMKRVRSSQYQLDIRPCAHIHDAQYYLIPDDMSILLYVNTHLVKAVQWQQHPDIQHPSVHLGGNLGIYYPNWSAECKIPNHANENEIKAIALEHFNKYCA